MDTALRQKNGWQERKPSRHESTRLVIQRREALPAARASPRAQTYEQVGIQDQPSSRQDKTRLEGVKQFRKRDEKHRNANAARRKGQEPICQETILSPRRLIIAHGATNCTKRLVWVVGHSVQVLINGITGNWEQGRSHIPRRSANPLTKNLVNKL